MSASSVTEVTSQSWFSRLGGAFRGILFGILLIGIGLVALFWNEGRTIRRAKALDEGAGVVVSVGSDQVDPSNDGKLVHMSGTASTLEFLEDEPFGIRVNAIRLERSVEMFQWREVRDSETRTKVGGSQEKTTTYSYEKGWYADSINSGGFKQSEGHENPGSMPFVSKTAVAQRVSVGAFDLSDGLVASIRSSQPLAVSPASELPGDLAWKSHSIDNGFYIGRDPSSPEIGDLRVRFEVTHPTPVSLVALQTGNRLGPFTTGRGESLQLLSTGTVPAAEMFQSAQESNAMAKWLLRLLGFVLVFFGFKTIFRPFAVMADVLPPVGRAIAAVNGVVAFLLAAALSACTIGVAWLYYRPALGITLLLVSFAGLVAAVMTIRKSRKETAA